MLSREEVGRRLTLDPEGFIPPITPGEKSALETARDLYAERDALQRRVRELGLGLACAIPCHCASFDEGDPSICLELCEDQCKAGYFFHSDSLSQPEGEG